MAEQIASKADHEFIVFGVDKFGKPRGARFQKFNEQCWHFVAELGLTSVYPASDSFRKEASKLPLGRIYATGKAFVPNVKRDVVKRLADILATPGDTSETYLLGPYRDPPVASETSQDDKIKTVSPITSGLPRSWDSVDVGHVVLVHESPVDGWWESTVLERDNEILVLRFRDYPRQPTFQRHISQVALINPGPNA